MEEFGKEGVLMRLRQLDDDLFALYGGTRRFELVLIRGSAFMLRDIAPDSRFTTDIDVMRSEREIEPLLARLDMNSDASTFLYSFPNGWESRKERVVLDGLCLDVFTPSIPDLAISKLLAWRAADQADLLAMVRAETFDEKAIYAILDDASEVRAQIPECDWRLLEERFGEVRGWRR